MNSYGYRYNVNHPQIRPYYFRFKKSLGVPEHIPISDIQRAEFERYMDKLWERGKFPPEALNNHRKENDL